MFSAPLQLFTGLGVYWGQWGKQETIPLQWTADGKCWKCFQLILFTYSLYSFGMLWQKTLDWWLKSQTFIYHSLRAGSLRSRSQQILCLVRAAFCACRLPSYWVSEQRPRLSLKSLISHEIHRGAFPSQPNHLPRPYLKMVEIQDSASEFGETHSVHSINHFVGGKMEGKVGVEEGVFIWFLFRENLPCATHATCVTSSPYNDSQERCFVPILEITKQRNLLPQITQIAKGNLNWDLSSSLPGTKTALCTLENAWWCCPSSQFRKFYDFLV